MISLNCPARSQSRQRGFSLIELMFTLMIAALVFGLAIPQYRGMTNSSRLVTQSNEIVGALNLARSEAITRNRSITFCAADSAASTSCNNSATNWAAWVVLAGGTLIRGGDINNYGSTLKVFSNLGNNTLTYASDGLARNSSSALISSETITACTTYTQIDKNILTVSPGAGSRISTAATKSTC